VIVVSVFAHQVRKYLGKIAGNKESKGLLVGAERIDAPTEFVILASTGIWEVIDLFLYISLHFLLLPYFPRISYAHTKRVKRVFWSFLSRL
jgi:hypothetical protein